VDGHSYLLSDIALSCETSEYNGYRAFAIFGVLVFPVGIVAFFTLLVYRQREKLPPDWWPAEEKTKCKERYEDYRKQHGRSVAKKFPAWKADVWDAEMAHHIKFYHRFGFLFAAYTKRFWWFESLLTIYKLAMTVLILFVSDKDEPKILFGMLGATLMLGIFSFYQPFKNPDLLSVNTGAQMAVLMVLFTAQYLLFNGGGNWLVTLLLITLTLTPLLAGVYMTLRVSELSYVPDASAELEKQITNLLEAKVGRSGSDVARDGRSGSGGGAAEGTDEMVMSEVNPLARAASIRNAKGSASAGSARNLAVDRGLGTYGVSGGSNQSLPGGKQRTTRAQQAQAKAQAARAARDGNTHNPMHGSGGGGSSSSDLGGRKQSTFQRMKSAASGSFFQARPSVGGSKKKELPSQILDSEFFGNTTAEGGGAAALHSAPSFIALNRHASHKSLDLSDGSMSSGLVQGGLPALGEGGGDARRASRLATTGGGVVLHSAQSAKNVAEHASLRGQVARRGTSGIGIGVSGIVEVDETHGGAETTDFETMQL